MRRSAVEAAVEAARRAFAQAGFALPAFADWTPEQWAQARGGHADRAGLGWDVTDYGGDDFASLGLILLTLRNGLASELSAGRGFCYAEKLMLVGQGRLAPMHRHRSKVEDIIVRAATRPGAALALELWPGGEAGPQRGRRARVLCDGVWRETGTDGRLMLTPGESVTLTPDIWHAFRGEGGAVVVGEVSSVNDDWADNQFEQDAPRFPAIEEDAPRRTVLAGERAARADREMEEAP